MDSPRIFSREYYQLLYDLEERHWWSIGMRLVAARLLGSPFQNRQHPWVLDAGCGTGGTLSWLGPYLSAERTVGIDFSAHALAFCQMRRLRRLAQASITHLPFRANCFDLVTCTDVLQHLPRDGADRAAIRECWRVLKPGGLLYVRTNVRLGPQRPGGGNDEQAPADYHQYTREELVDLLAAAGFVLQTVTYANMLPALVASGLRRAHLHRARDDTDGPDRGLTIRLPPGWLNTAMRLVMYAEARYVGGGSRALPYGASLICLGAKPAADPQN